ncbi:MAG: DNA-binding transcriptional regulator [Chloroflexota bacterium]|nr:MAG: DNA-binding transcriptional regulator [Chloroflexota bacterium]
MPRPVSQPDLRLLAKVSCMYYEQKLTQQEIAQRLHLSRPKVSRLLQQAEEAGIVQIIIKTPSGVLHADLEARLEQMFGLLEVFVVDVEAGASQEIISRRVGAAAAAYLQRTVEAGDTIGFAWGTTLNGMVSALTPIEVKNVHVVQLIGGLGPPESDLHAAEVCRRLAHLLNAKLTLIPAPGIVGSEEMKEIVLADSYVQSAFRQFSAINVAYLGIGVPSPDSVMMRDGSIITEEELAMLKAKGALGDIVLRFFDKQGQHIRSDVDSRVIGITLEDLSKIERVVGVAGGPLKDEVVLGALRGGLINVLITDAGLATRILERG